MANLEDQTRAALARARQAAGLTLADLAQRTGISASTLSRIEAGSRRLTVDALQEISFALGTTATALLADAAREELVMLPAPPIKMTGGLSGIELRVEDDGRSLLRLTVPRRQSLHRTYTHPGTEWLHVLRGRLRLVVGPRDVTLAAGKTVQFVTNLPHAFGGVDGPAEILSRFEPGAHQP